MTFNTDQTSLAPLRYRYSPHSRVFSWLLISFVIDAVFFLCSYFEKIQIHLATTFKKKLKLNGSPYTTPQLRQVQTMSEEAPQTAIERLKRSENHFRMLLDESMDPTFSFYKDGTYRYVTIIFTVFLVIASIPTNTYCTALQLTEDEQAWITSHPVIRISGPQAFPPFQYVDKKGRLQGMASDYIKRISQMAGFTIEPAQNRPWPEILKAMQEKKIDLLTCAVKTKDRLDYLTFSTPHLSFPLVIISRTDYPYIDGLKGLHNKKVAIVEKNSTVELLQRDNLDVTFHFVPSPLEALRAVSLGEAEVAVENLAAATYLIEKYGLTNLKVAAPTSYGNYSLSIAIRKDWPELTAIINKALAAITVEEHNAIRSKWISVQYEKGLISLPAIFKWLAVAVTIVCLIVLFFSYWTRKLTQEIAERQRVEQENQQLIGDLQQALSEIQTLQGILPICSHCKKIRDDKGIWNQIETYVAQHSEAEFSHGICLDCAKSHYPELISPTEKEDDTT